MNKVMEIRDKIIAKYKELVEMYEMELIIGQSHKRKNRIKRQIISLNKELQEQKPAKEITIIEIRKIQDILYEKYQEPTPSEIIIDIVEWVRDNEIG